MQVCALVAVEPARPCVRLDVHPSDGADAHPHLATRVQVPEGLVEQIEADPELWLVRDRCG